MTREMLISVEGRPAMLSRLKRIEEWRWTRLQRLLADPARDDERAIRAARHFREVGARRVAVERGVI